MTRGIMASRIERLRRKTFIIIFGTQTRAGKLFDIVLIWAILLSVIVVILLSVPGITPVLRYVEWFFTILFTLEYSLRLWSIKNKAHYAFSFWGIIDLLAVLPTYLSLHYPGGHFLLVIRIIRL